MTARLNLEVLVNVKGARELDSVSGKLGAVGGKLTRGVTLPVLALGGAAVKLGADAQKADAQLGAAFKSMGAGAFTTIDALNEQATALAKATQFDDEEIKHGQAIMLTFANVTGESFDRATASAVDLAAALGTDTQSQAIRLGKALNDPVKGVAALTRAGIQFTDQQKEQIAALVESGDVLGAQNIILGEVEKQFGGVAAAIGATDAGQAAQAFEELGEAGESIGQILLPVLANLSGILAEAAKWFQSLSPEMKGFIVTLLTVAAAVGPVLLIGSKLVGAFKAVGVAFNVLKVLMLTNPFIALAVAIAAIAALIILNWDKIVGFLKGVWDKITGGFQALAKALTGIWTGITSAVKGAWEGVINIIRGAINGIIDVINGLFGFLNNIQIGIPEINVGPVHVGGGTIDPFNIGLIPHLAEGGIIDGATLALIGENGPEAVVPLNKLPLEEKHFHSHIEVKGEDPFIRNPADLVRVQNRIAFLEGF